MCIWSIYIGTSNPCAACMLLLKTLWMHQIMTVSFCEPLLLRTYHFCQSLQLFTCTYWDTHYRVYLCQVWSQLVERFWSRPSSPAKLWTLNLQLDPEWYNNSLRKRPASKRQCLFHHCDSSMQKGQVCQRCWKGKQCPWPSLHLDSKALRI